MSPSAFRRLVLPRSATRVAISGREAQEASEGGDPGSLEPRKVQRSIERSGEKPGCSLTGLRAFCFPGSRSNEFQGGWRNATSRVDQDLTGSERQASAGEAGVTDVSLTIWRGIYGSACKGKVASPILPMLADPDADVAQLVGARVSQTRGRRFEAGCPLHYERVF